ncbi:hypothetical protein BKA82DRAFT_740627 [Pisolithus tinctorius]|uniref:Uncharacterized protein n=1 Tax=Pisolithus tinctorius Marx 270 TaxID=870435 RepID=A0A0C3JUB4_PISTI|nr:hypothetical protein BKA82DRAFT_740627 [Pisolithus tinctorius]KIO01047.1 hypothetical protein M404DRAFT_740627 [Pisolithus tinctorius Marx 270]
MSNWSPTYAPGVRRYHVSTAVLDTKRYWHTLWAGSRRRKHLRLASCGRRRNTFASSRSDAVSCERGAILTTLKKIAVLNCKSQLDLRSLGVISQPRQSSIPSFPGSVWFRRGWALWELLALPTVLFYLRNWSLYMDCKSPNPKTDEVVLRGL